MIMSLRPVCCLSLLLLGVQTLAVAADRGAAVPSIPGAGDYVAVPDASMLASPDHTYKVVFDARHGAEHPNELAPAVLLAASEINTLAAHGVPRENARFAIVFHTAPSDDAVLDDAHYKARFGVANPNLPVLAKLKDANLDLYVCGQELLADGVPLDAVAKDVTIVEDGLIALIALQNQGYALLSF